MTPRVIRATAMPRGTPDVPVAIVGAGACGLVAATFLQAQGIEAVLLERDPGPHGSTALSSGFIPAAGTRVQRLAGVDDDAERFAADIQLKAKGQAAARLVEAYTRAIGPALDRLQAQHGLTFELLDGFLYPGHHTRRMHAVPERTGAALITALERTALATGAVVVGSATAHEVWCNNDGTVLGVGYLRPDGHTEHLACRSLLLACNGYGGNPALVARWLPEMRDAVYAGHSGNDGTALLWGEQLGAATGDLGAYQGHGSWAVPHGVLITWALMMQGGIQVNREGRRFHDETQGYSEASVAVLAQPGAMAWNVIDSSLLTLGRDFPDFVQAEAAGAVRRAEDLGSLARIIGCGPDVLAETLAGTRLQAPYAAIRITGALFHTQGGLDIDAHARVLQRDGRPFPNLLAAGGAARGVSGPAVWGYLSGNGLLSAVAGGAIAAETIHRALQ